MTQEMFCLQGVKLAEKPRGWLGCSDISNHAGSAATQDRFLLPTPRCWTSWATAPKCSSCQLQLKAVLLVLNSDQTWKRLGASQVCTRGNVEKHRGHLYLVVGACLTDTQARGERVRWEGQALQQQRDKSQVKFSSTAMQEGPVTTSTCQRQDGTPQLGSFPSQCLLAEQRMFTQRNRTLPLQVLLPCSNAVPWRSLAFVPTGAVVQSLL